VAPERGRQSVDIWPVARFPLLWRCFERADHMDVVRLLGERQDPAAILGGEFAAD
jgi:toxin ParE1/3/4